MAIESERRTHPRVPAHFLVQYRFDTSEPFVAEYAHDISEGGVLIKDPEVVRPVGSTAYLQFTLRGGTQLIEGLSRIVRVDDAPEPSMALAFVDIDEGAKSLIRGVVAAQSRAISAPALA